MQVRGPKSGFRRTIALRRDLRHHSTPAELVFWSKVADRQFQNLKFRRQHGIADLIVDFYCPELKLIVEIDGDTHAETKVQDQERTAYLESLGYTVIRYNNRDIMNNIDGVFEDLSRKLNQTMTPLTSPLMTPSAELRVTLSRVEMVRGERGRSWHHEGEKKEEQPSPGERGRKSWGRK